MDVPGYVWLLTVIGIVAMLAFDFISTSARLTRRR
jgi:hypothetical protein